MKLRAYQIHSAYKLRKAPLERAWMDATPSAYAYRCLPLNVANQHGWEILSPVRVQAYWDGGEGKESVRIISPYSDDLVPHSTFGSGVMTFPVPFLFRTEPGVQLYTMGPPNVQKDGLQPLSGVIETDWSPYTFTMNYRFTRPNQVITFDAGEPYAMLFPVRMDLIEAAEPEVVPIEANPELCRTFEAWREGRKTFYETAQADSESEEAKRGWEKNYFQGYLPTGERAPVRHRTKLKLREFKAIDPASLQDLETEEPVVRVLEDQ